MSLTDALIKYLDRKFDLTVRTQNKLITQQNELIVNQNTILAEMLAFWKFGPAFLEETFKDADDEKIDDDYGEYDVLGQAKKQIHKEWADAGYPNDPLFPERD